MSDFLPARSQKVGLYSMSEPIPTTHSPPPRACTAWARGPERLPKGQAGLPRSQNAARRLWARNRKRSEAVHNRSTRRQLPSKLPLRACTLQPTRSDFPQVGAGVGRFAGLGLAVAHPRRVGSPSRLYLGNSPENQPGTAAGAVGYSLLICYFSDLPKPFQNAMILFMARPQFLACCCFL